MNREKIVWLKIESLSYYNVLIKLNQIGVSIFDNKKFKDYILIKVSYSDFKRIKKYLLSYKISIYSKVGLDKCEELIKKYIVFFLSTILGIFILIGINNLIFKVDVKSPNKNTQKLLIQELDSYGLGKLKLKKNHRKVEKIVNKILDNNKDTLEWLEVKYDGLVMVVNVTEKVKKNNTKKYNNCNIIAKTDAKISSLNIYRGVAIKEINDYVLKGDVIISGSIMHNEEVKNTVCAGGKVFGEVWYKVKIRIPLKEDYISYTGNNRYNLNVHIKDNIYQIFKSRIKNKKEENINLYKLNDFEINLVKEKEYEKKSRVLTSEEAYNKGIRKAVESVKVKLQDNEEILYKKVLKKEENDSTIYLEIFIVTKESIGELQVVGDNNDFKLNS